MKSGTRVSTSGWIVSVAAMAVTALLYYADVRNVPVIANWLDFLAEGLYHWMPILARLAPNAAMFVSSLMVGLVFFVVATVLVACFVPASRIGALESRMRSMQRKRRPSSVKVE